jgi:hypothetical protein
MSEELALVEREVARVPAMVMFTSKRSRLVEGLSLRAALVASKKEGTKNEGMGAHSETGLNFGTRRQYE